MTTASPCMSSAVVVAAAPVCMLLSATGRTDGGRPRRDGQLLPHRVLSPCTDALSCVCQAERRTPRCHSMRLRLCERASKGPAGSRLDRPRRPVNAPMPSLPANWCEKPFAPIRRSIHPCPAPRCTRRRNETDRGRTCRAPLRFARSASQKSFSACCPAPQSAEPKAAVTRPPAHACVCGCSRSGVVACIYRARRRHCAHRARAAGHHCVGAVCFPFPHRRAPGMSLATAAGGVGSASQSQNRTEEGVPFVINAAAGTRTRMSMTPHGHGGRPDRPSPIAASSALPCRVIRRRCVKSPMSMCAAAPAPASSCARH